jgi:hypothetical protein
MITRDYALLQVANLRVSYADRDMRRIAEHFVHLTSVSDAKDIIIALLQTSDLPTGYFRKLIKDNSDITEMPDV